MRIKIEIPVVKDAVASSGDVIYGQPIFSTAIAQELRALAEQLEGANFAKGQTVDTGDAVITYYEKKDGLDE